MTAGAKRFAKGKDPFLWLRALVLLLCATGFIWFLLPVFGGGYNGGSLLGQGLCAVAACFALWIGKMQKRWVKRMVNGLLAAFLLLLCWFGFLTAKIVTAEHSSAIPEGTTVAVLGAKVLRSGAPSVSLRTRLDTALAHLLGDPSARCIVTGGKGSDEPITEAESARNYLVEKGIAPERIFLEDRSVNTAQNMAFSFEIATKNNLGTDLLIATQGFHQYRAACLGRDVGFTTYAAVAYTNPILYPAYYGRELLSLTKYYAEKFFKREGSQF